MEFLGDIVASPDPPGVDLERWKQVIAGHPNLAPAAPVVGINPFTREPLTYHPHPARLTASPPPSRLDWAVSIGATAADGPAIVARSGTLPQRRQGLLVVDRSSVPRREVGGLVDVAFGGGGPLREHR